LSTRPGGTDEFHLNVAFTNGNVLCYLDHGTEFLEFLLIPNVSEIEKFRVAIYP